MSPYKYLFHKSSNDFLDENTFSTYPSMNPVLRDMAVMNGTFITENHYITLLTLHEAQLIADSLLGKTDKFFNYRAGPGNIKDAFEGARSIGKLTSYYNALGKLVFNLNFLSIKAVQYNYRGKDYIKITGYPSMRRILNGTRYNLNNPQILEMAIGMRGLGTSIIKGAKFCICYSLAWRVVELIFKSEYDLVDFLVDVTMDAAKIIVSSVVIGVVGGIAILLSAPIVLTTIGIIALGFYLNIRLNKLDDDKGLSASLKEKLRIALEQEQRIKEWNNENTSLFFNLLSNTSE